MTYEPSEEIKAIKEITLAPDFYAWKAKMAAELKSAGALELAKEVAEADSVLGLYLKKGAIVAALNL